MNLGLQGKVYIVAGGASSIGEAVCKLIANEGGVVVIADENKEKSTALANEIINQNQSAFIVEVELTNEESCRQLIDAVVSQYNRIDGLINNARTNDKVGLESGTVKGFEQLLHFNLLPYFIMAHSALPHLIKTEGSIVNIGSEVFATEQGNTLGYAASKGGVSALTREWAVDLLPYKIRVNAVMPAEVNMTEYAARIKQQPDAKQTLQHITSQIPFGSHFIPAEEIANTVVFLLSEQSSHTTGQIIFVDGSYAHLNKTIV